MFRFIVLTALLAVASANVIPRLDGRIVGGTATTIDKYPHQVALLYRGSQSCGGSIVSQTAVVTAAHCVYQTSASLLSIRAGSTSSKTNGQVVNVKQVIVHANYNDRTVNYDIAVLILASPLTFNTNVRAIALADQAPAAGSKTEVTGWGSTTEGGNVVENLRVVEVTLFSNQECSQKLGSSSMTQYMLCAGVPNGGGKDACQGDSGGPMIQNGKLLGIVSWGYGCARPNLPGVYTNVPALRSWVRQYVPTA